MMGYPKCPKCKSDMVPLSEPREGIGVKDYCLIFGKWKCVKCEYEIGYYKNEEKGSRKSFPTSKKEKV